MNGPASEKQISFVCLLLRQTDKRCTNMRNADLRGWVLTPENCTVGSMTKKLAGRAIARLKKERDNMPEPIEFTDDATDKQKNYMRGLFRKTDLHLAKFKNDKILDKQVLAKRNIDIANATKKDAVRIITYLKRILDNKRKGIVDEDLHM